MKKLFIVFCFVGFIAVNPLAAHVNNVAVQEIVEVTTIDNQDYIGIIINVLEEMGFEVEEVKLLQKQILKSCKVTVKGTIDGVEVEVEIIIEGMTCAELIKALTEK